MGMRPTRENVVWGIWWGARFGLAFSIIGIIPALIRAGVGTGVWWQKGLSFVALMALYLTTGLLGGAILGLLRNLVPLWWGRRLIGALIGVQFMFAVRLLIYGWNGWNREEVVVWCVIGTGWGLMMSFVPEADARERWPSTRGRRRT